MKAVKLILASLSTGLREARYEAAFSLDVVNLPSDPISACGEISCSADPCSLRVCGFSWALPAGNTNVLLYAMAPLPQTGTQRRSALQVQLSECLF